MMKTNLLIAVVLALAPLYAATQPTPGTLQLLQWQRADAPVALVEEIIDPALRFTSSEGRPLLAVRVLAQDYTLIQDGTLLILEAEEVEPATQGIARRWILNLAALQHLRHLHVRGEVLQATAPAGTLASLKGLEAFNWNQKTRWASIMRHAQQKISPEEVRRLPIICRENFTPISRLVEKDGKRYEQYSLVCDMALPEPWCKGYLPGERIIIHFPEKELQPGGSNEARSDTHGYQSGDFIITDHFERQGNTLHLYWDKSRRVSGHAGNTEAIAAMLTPENAPRVALQVNEYSPYMPDAAAFHNATKLERDCHFVYKGAERHDTLLRCRYIDRRLIALEGRLKNIKCCEFRVVEVLECLKGNWKPGKRIAFWQYNECSREAERYKAEGEFFLGFNHEDAEWLPTENLDYLGRDDFQFTNLRAEYYNEAMQKVMQEYPKLFGKEKPAEKKPGIDTEQARQIAIRALREQQLVQDGAYNVQGYGSYLCVYPAQGTGARVLLRQDGEVARIFTPDAPLDAATNNPPL